MGGTLSQTSGKGSTIQWLLEGDSAIRWQTLQDLMEASKKAVLAERKKVARCGWGARLLALQEPSGTWSGGLYTPKWTSTTYTMLELRDMGLETRHPAALKACASLLEKGLMKDGGINYAVRWRRGETCITGMILSLLSHFEFDDARIERLIEYILGEQMEDGGWNCQRCRGATHASVHTTILVLEGLRDYSRFRGPSHVLSTAQARGREFLLAHRLFRSHRTGKVIKAEFTRFVFPPRWHYDILRALDYFRDCGANPDSRMDEGLGIVRAKRREDGRWLLPRGYPGRVHFDLEKSGEPSRWNTLRALRVLRWFEKG